MGDHNVIVSYKMPLGGSVIIPGTHYVYEFTLIFTTSADSYKIRMMQGKFNYNKTSYEIIFLSILFFRYILS